MSTYPGEVKVQEASCNILASLATTGERREVIAGKGGVEAVLMAVINHGEMKPAGMKLLRTFDKSELAAARDVLTKAKDGGRVASFLNDIEEEVRRVGDGRAGK